MKKDREYHTILDVRIGSTPKDQLLIKIGKKIASGHKFYVVTPNPEIILQAQKDSGLREILNKADISLADGSGLRLANPRLLIVPGREFAIDLMDLANRHGLKVFLLGGSEEVNKRAQKVLSQRFRKLKIYGEGGTIYDSKGVPVSEVDVKRHSDTLDRINIIRPDVLLVALGAPKQEYWISKNLPNIKVKCAMAVGGALDYVAGQAKLPPKWIRRAGFEWLWRLIREPWRAPRIFGAVVIFPLLLFWSKFTKR